ncbi:MAG: hypothetical protein AAF441_24945 [Pseudomonadota bacterium]
MLSIARTDDFASEPVTCSRTAQDGRTLAYIHRLCAQCEKMTGARPVEVSFPAGKGRASFRAVLSDGRSVIITRREEQARAQLEERVLHTLSAWKAPVPDVLAFNGLVLVQSDKGSSRLSELLIAQLESAEDALHRAAESLLSVHTAARKSGLAGCVPILGADGDWVRALIDRPAVIGSHLDHPAPEPDLDGIYSLLMLLDPAFVKWDARPANAVVGRDGKVSWIDWEHCGARNRLDDLVWLLCDETVPEDPLRDRRLIDEFAAKFDRHSTAGEAAEYVRVMGVFHFAVRLCLILARTQQHGWKDAETLAAADKVGASLRQARTVCARAADWAQTSRLTRALSPWFDHLGRNLA